MADAKEEYEKLIVRYTAAQKDRDDLAKTHNSQIITFSSDAMKAPMLVAAGGVAAVLGFYSANYARLKLDPGNLEAFNGILFWLFLSLFFSMLAPGAAYFSQYFYWKSLYAETVDLTPPFCHPTKLSRFYDYVGHAFRWTSVGAVVSAIGCLSLGGLVFLQLVG